MQIRFRICCIARPTSCSRDCSIYWSESLALTKSPGHTSEARMRRRRLESLRRKCANNVKVWRSQVVLASEQKSGCATVILWGRLASARRTSHRPKWGQRQTEKTARLLRVAVQWLKANKWKFARNFAAELPAPLRSQYIYIYSIYICTIAGMLWHLYAWTCID